jgi:nicotianamine synthase
MNSMILDTVLHKLSFLDSFEDTAKTRAIMSDIVAMARALPDDVADFDDLKLEAIWNIMYSTEYQMEKALWLKIIHSTNPWKTLKQFIYFHNYELLTQNEIKALLSEAEEVHDMLFVGWGPVPLSAIIMARKYDINITIIDNDQEAIEVSRQVIQRLGLSRKIVIEKADVCTYVSSKSYDAIIVAAMVFADTNHEKIIKNLKILATPQNHIIKRTTSWVRQLFYRPISPSIISDYFSIKKVFHPTWNSELINSFYLSTINK